MEAMCMLDRARLPVTPHSSTHQLGNGNFCCTRNCCYVFFILQIPDIKFEGGRHLES